MNAADAAANGSTQMLHVGTPPSDLDSLSGHFSAFGRTWSVVLGKSELSPFEDSISVHISLVGSLDSPVIVRFEVGTWYPKIIPSPGGRLTLRSRVATISRGGFSGWDDFSGISIGDLVDGALILKLVMYADHPPQSASVADEFIPTNPFLGNVLKEYGNEETSDVTIEVAGEARRRKRARTDSTTFHAHQFVLRCNAPTLAEMCKPGDESTPIRIGNVSPETFRHLLHYCYGGKISDEDMEKSARDIIDAADRFGVANLKLEAEACLVRKETFTVENILDNLQYADSKNCALLLEKAMDFVVEKKKDIIGKISLDDLPGTMVMDVLTAVAQEGGKSGPDDDVDFMRVSELRQRLHEKGLCVDGSRKAMVALLKENSRESSAGE
ncbi:hypothetical protein THAOC_26249 [Thalassiosira oceanica]|uniref:BTB domain-containing protein n=1 Tax=Thalassiosira oceanica TaxID=159749 RepID=K0RZM5_THAOC|nr:hypothetical protein THAOC_26249 [Thalassiosira oceanica]|eukprot:EJK54186.1 hypothetical protein THAOC_26249 [Thalassiosira oceanica]